ncbi:MAG: arginine--tRNA ligase [Nanoarchaeota archaeon]|nr:arginine--tRNA ligase [Nanoarchaeota archaeon]
MKKQVVQILFKALQKINANLKEDEIGNLVEVPPKQEMGDFAFPCFPLAKQLKINPHEVALKIREKIGNTPKGFSDVRTQGPYVNFFLDRKVLALDLINEIKTQGDNYGKSDFGKGKTILVEFSSPNIAKPFGIGHLRSTIIGNSLANIAEANGFKTVRLNYLGDWGTQFGKLITAYNHFVDKKKFKADPLKHLFELYVKINKSKKYEEESRYWFNQLEQGNKTALELWEKFKSLSLKDFEKTYSLLGVKFDVFSGESMYNKEMKDVVAQLQNKKILKEDQGAQIVDLNEFGLGIALIKKSDGSTLYMTRDLAAAISRKSKYNFDYMIYEVGQEQKLHFAQVFKILELMGYSWAKNCIHVEHGLYLDKDGKKFATRKGKTIFMNNVLEKTKELSEKEIKKRDKKISKKNLNERSLKVAIAAIFYGDLKNNRKNDAIFDLKKFVSFDGDTGPYLLYSYARANSITKKSKNPFSQFVVESLDQKETELILKLNEFPSIVLKAYESLNPSVIANYSFQLAQTFNEFYHACPVLKSKNENFRLALVESFKQVLKNSLNLLGIETINEM